jgi:hypothetical protein
LDLSDEEKPYRKKAGEIPSKNQNRTPKKALEKISEERSINSDGDDKL